MKATYRTGENFECLVRIECVQPYASSHHVSHYDSLRSHARQASVQQDPSLSNPSPRDPSPRDPSPRGLRNVETSVLWSTDGKGDTNIGVHFFERRTLESTEPRGIAHAQLESHLQFPVATQLPFCPVSYRGQIVRINWGLKLRVFTTDDSEFQYFFPFRLVDRFADA